MATVRVKIDVAGTLGDEAWRRIRPFDQAQAVVYGAEVGGSGACAHSPEEPHRAGEWRVARVTVPTYLLAQYAVRHYLEQDRVLDADIE
jgi:hypothetical protein